nr:RNA-directed DNA polymerase, eukaryota [Tanacetum cinerariifolium]
MGSILVNGNPTPKFKYHKGLKQGSPLSPFLSILIMESLYFLFKNVVNASAYKVIPIDDTLTLSHLFYADDVMFVGKWDMANVNTIVNVLKCFFLDSNLKINLYKSKLMGIGIPHNEVVLAAKSIGCLTFSVPFNFLDVKVGGIMSGCSSWDEAFLFKWIWRFISQDPSLRSRFIKGMYGPKGALDNPHIITRRSPWLDLTREFKSLSLK